MDRDQIKLESGRAPLAEKPLAVLIVEDEPETREFYVHYFQFRGLLVRTAADGVEALQEVEWNRPDVILLDFTLPLLSGWEVIRELRSRWSTRRIPIVVVSGHKVGEAALQAGADSYFEKPCVPEYLFREILRVFREPTRPRDH